MIVRSLEVSHICKALKEVQSSCDAIAGARPPTARPAEMLRVRSLRRTASGKTKSQPAIDSLPITPSQSSKPRFPIVPLALLFLCGLVAARVFPDSNLISGEGGLGPGIVLPHLQQPKVALPGGLASPSAANLTGLGLRCQTWCLTRDTYVTMDEVAHCQGQCLAHPEVMEWIPALEASAAAPAGISDRKIIFAAWYAEGERGSEVGHAFAMHVLLAYRFPGVHSTCMILLSGEYKPACSECQWTFHYLRMHVLVNACAFRAAAALVCFTPRTAHRLEVILGGGSQQLLQQIPASIGILLFSICVAACVCTAVLSFIPASG